MNKSDFSKAQAGDRVWSPFGPECEVGGTNGVIRKVYSEGVSTDFNDGSVYFFTLKGIYHRGIDSFPSLFWCRPAIEIPPPPKRTKWVEVKGKPYEGTYGIAIGVGDAGEEFYCGPVQTIEIEVYDE